MMQIISENTYSVMDGEPHLGKQIETVVQVDRDEYIEELVDAILEGANHTSDGFTVRGLYEQEYTLGDDLAQNEIDNIRSEMDIRLLDDDYGTDKAYDLIFNLVDGYIADTWTDEFEIVEMRGY